ncbi:hypothetical protein [uncultured Corynebacterium sp.]|uniref:hypothetical protein n=1 Tax=uncultured Corynebacterium sp. TaxID=159447 RepID=UPI0025E1546B|nr:hypothetical protein [uncultured Corynebacterium sp.]
MTFSLSDAALAERITRTAGELGLDVDTLLERSVALYAYEVAGLREWRAEAFDIRHGEMRPVWDKEKAAELDFRD